MKKTAAVLIVGALLAGVALAVPASADDYPEKQECINAIAYIQVHIDQCKQEADAVGSATVSCETRAKAQSVFSKFASCRKKVVGDPAGSSVAAADGGTDGGGDAGHADAGKKK